MEERPMIEVNCPHCGFMLRIKPKYAGLKGKCIQCKGRLQVPGPGEPQVATALPKRAKDIAAEELPAGEPSAPPPMQRELPTASKTPKPVPPVESTALADLKEPSGPKAPAKPAPLPVSTSLDDLHKADDAELLEDGAGDVPLPARPRSGGQLWVLVAGLVVGVPFVLLTIFVVGNSVFPSGSTPVTHDGVADAPRVPEAPASPLMGVRPAAGNTSGPRSRQTPAYAATGLPTYPGLVFTAAPNSDNPLFATMNAAGPPVAQTFQAFTTEDSEEISKTFYLQLEAQNWTITNSGMGEQANKEVFIYASKGGQNLAYYTVVRGQGAAVYVTLAGAQTASGTESAAEMVAIPLHEFPHYPGLTLAPGSALPSYTSPTGETPEYQAAFEGTVAATVAGVSEFYKDALDGDRWGWTNFSHAEGPDQPFVAKGGRGNLRYVLEGKSVARGTHVVLAFVQPGTPF
jgi:hypothetical protein